MYIMYSQCYNHQFYSLAHLKSTLSLCQDQKNLAIAWIKVAPSETYPIIICTVEVPGHAKVPNLTDELVSHKAVPCGKIPMDEVL